MSLFGRGAWVLYDTTAYFPTARVLRFGLADNDSAPLTSILTNGIYASRDLEKVGSGTLTIGGTTSFTGATNVRRGTLVANGNLTSSSGVFVDPDATLAGTGILPSTVVSGTVAPGNSIGTLTVNGNFVQNAGSVYRVEANNAGQSDRINVSGSATINGGTVQVVAQPGTYARRTTYTILNATGGVSGAYSGVTSNFAFLTPGLGYDANNVYLLLTSGSFAAGAQTANQYAVGGALDIANVNAVTGDFSTALNALSALSTADGPAALNAISGQPWADFGTLNVQGGALFMNTLGQQMAVARGGAIAGGQRQALAQACEIENCDAARHGHLLAERVHEQGTALHVQRAEVGPGWPADGIERRRPWAVLRAESALRRGQVTGDGVDRGSVEPHRQPYWLAVCAPAATTW